MIRFLNNKFSCPFNDDPYWTNHTSAASLRNTPKRGTHPMIWNSFQECNRCTMKKQQELINLALDNPELSQNFRVIHRLITFVSCYCFFFSSCPNASTSHKKTIINLVKFVDKASASLLKCLKDTPAITNARNFSRISEFMCACIKTLFII